MKPALRAGRVGDVNHIFHTWLRSYAHAATRIGGTRRDFFVDYQGVLRNILARADLVIATLPDTPDAILGWACIEGDTLHFVHVKERWRRFGVAKLLLSGRPIAFYTHRTELCHILPIPADWRYRPFRAFTRNA